jgi:hypothetical protein
VTFDISVGLPFYEGFKEPHLMAQRLKKYCFAVSLWPVVEYLRVSPDSECCIHLVRLNRQRSNSSVL